MLVSHGVRQVGGLPVVAQPAARGCVMSRGSGPFPPQSKGWLLLRTGVWGVDSDAAELRFLKCVSEMLSHWFKGRRAGRPQTLQGCVFVPDSRVPSLAFSFTSQVSLRRLEFCSSLCWSYLKKKGCFTVTRCWLKSQNSPCYFDGFYLCCASTYI